MSSSSDDAAGPLGAPSLARNARIAEVLQALGVQVEGFARICNPDLRDNMERKGGGLREVAVRGACAHVAAGAEWRAARRAARAPPVLPVCLARANSLRRRASPPPQSRWPTARRR